MTVTPGVEQRPSVNFMMESPHLPTHIVRIQEIVLTANLTPRKCLGFKTPFQAILAELGKDVQIRFS